MPRLFSGIVLPPDVRQQLAMLKSPLPGAKWIEPDNLHLTLRFAGDIDNHQAADFADALNQIQCAPFDLSLRGLGVFGGKSPTAVWAGVLSNPQLSELARLHERAARRAGLKPDTRKFVGHVTLARLRHSKAPAIARFLQQNGGFQTIPFEVGSFVLFSARPRTGGGPYVVEQTYALDPATAPTSYAQTSPAG